MANLSIAERHTRIIKTASNDLGFLSCGISKAEFLNTEAKQLEDWLNKNYQGEMSYMERNFDKRIDPTKLFPGAKSVVSFLLNYYPEERQIDPEAPKISKYAYGEDYHFVIKRKLKSLMEVITDNIGEVHGRAFVDSAPVMDKVWAARSGLGWVGKHSNLINKNAGSFFFIAELILDLDLISDEPTQDHCGTCTKCIDACPTDAIVQPYEVDGSKCISYFTIELKGEIPLSQKGKFENWAFGCDICQDVCPWNRFSKVHDEKSFNPKPGLLELTNGDWNEITEEVFKKIAQKSAMKRAKYEGIKRNIKFLN